MTKKKQVPVKTSEEICLAKIEEICKELKKNKIPFEATGNSGDTKIPVVLLNLEVGRLVGTIVLHVPEDNIDNPKEFIYPVINLVNVNKRFRQAVLRLTEEARTFTHEVVITQGSTSSKTKNIKSPDRNSIINRFPIALGDKVSWTINFKEEVKLERSLTGNYQSNFVFDVTAKVPRTDQCFLLGFDEKHLFVSMLPGPVKTVEEAHQVLLPKELKRKKLGKDYLRQGEFFFIPVTDREIKLLSNENVYFTSTWSLEKEENGSDHQASVGLLLDGIQYVSGYISNSRHSLFLNGWYRVINNLELPNPNDSLSWD